MTAYIIFQHKEGGISFFPADEITQGGARDEVIRRGGKGKYVHLERDLPFDAKEAGEAYFALHTPRLPGPKKPDGDGVVVPFVLNKPQA